MIAKVKTLMEELHTSGGGQVPGASTIANPQIKSTYDPMAFSPLPRASNPVGMTAPLKGISPRAIAPHIHSRPTLREMRPKTSGSLNTTQCVIGSHDVGLEPNENCLHRRHG